MTAEQSGADSGAPDAVRAAVASLHLSRWGEVERRLIIRAAATTGPDATGIELEVVLPVFCPPSRSEPGAEQWDGNVRLAALPTRLWSVSPERIWQAAADNTKRLVRPVVTAVSAGPFHAWLFTGDRFTSGVAVDIGYFIRTSGADPDGPARRPVMSEEAGWWSVLSEQAVVLVVPADGFQRGPDRTATSSHPADIDSANLHSADLNSGAIDIIAELRRRTTRPLPLNLFRYGAAGSARPAEQIQHRSKSSDDITKK